MTVKVVERQSAVDASPMRDIWNAAADSWHAHHTLIRSWLSNASSSMLDAAMIGVGAHVLEVAAGSGDQTVDIAHRVGATGQVLATDLSPRCIELAHANVQRAGLSNVAFQVADGERLEVGQGFDAVVCRLGLMFFADPLQGLQSMQAALKPAGHCAVLVFSDAASNPCIVSAMRTATMMTKTPPPDPTQAGGLLSLGRSGVLHDLFVRAGFTGVTTIRIAAPMRLPSASHYVRFLQEAAGPVRTLIARLDEQSQSRAWMTMETEMEQYMTPAGWVGPNELLLTIGRRS